MKKIILILFSLNTFALSLTEKSLCFYSEGSRADIINYTFFTDGSSEIRGLSQEGEVLFQDELTWSEKKLGEELVVNIKFP